MFDKLLLFSLILISLQYFCVCTECFDFQCFDGGYKKNSNCFKCMNVSIASEKQWIHNFDRLIDVSQKLKKFNLARKYQKKKNEGMYCCSINNTYAHSSCSVSLSSGSSDGMTHFGMSCTSRDIWSSAMCHKKDIGVRCCRESHCNSPNIYEMEHMMNMLKMNYPFLTANDNKVYYKYLIAVLVSIALLGIMVFCAIRLIKSIDIKGISTLESSQNKSFNQKMYCIHKLFNLICSKKRIKKPKEKGVFSSFSDSTMEHNNSFDYLPCSGSGAGKPLMTKRTPATDISLVRIVGDGRFGTVWLGKWNGDNVAVKIFSTRDERSWAREKQMYQKNFLRHNNVLGYIATDSRDNGMSTELWLVTDYHENGSLFDYLRCHVLSVEQAVRMVRSITNGLAYLHIEINGTEPRPGIAHRDLKSRNILVKSSGECCIGDLGLAVRLNEDCSALDTNRVGTRRYMAPEVILDNIVITDLCYNGGLDAFKKADIYSYGLVLWEILRRCQCPSMAIESSLYEMPYQSLVSSDPSIEEMREVVCVKKVRPTLNATWDGLSPLKEISKSIHETWFEDPASRLTIMRLKKIMATVWSDVMDLRSSVIDISTIDDPGLINDGNNDNNDSGDITAAQYWPSAQCFVCTELPPASVTSNDIPNIVIRTTDNVFTSDRYSSVATTNAAAAAAIDGVIT